MKKILLILTTAILGLGLLPAFAQFGKPGSSAADNALFTVFGTNLNFSANMEMDAKLPSHEDEVTMPGKIYFANGNTRTEMDMTKIKGSQMPPHAADQMKAMGMDQIVSIFRNDTKTVYLIYPGFDSYAKMAAPATAQGAEDSKMETTQLSKETLDGHPCVKNQYTVTNAKTGEKLTLIAWLATDLKNYPIKIQMNPPADAKGQADTTTTLHFTDISLAQPAASLFEPPLGYRVYTDPQAMVQTEMMKKMGGGTAMPPGHLPPGHPQSN